MKLLIKQIMILFLFLMVSVGTVSAESFPNTPIHWGFKKSANEQPPDAGRAWDEIMRKHGAIYKGDPSKKDIYLTFDNGYENGYTSKVLDVLKKEKVPAIFFVTGHYLEREPDLVKRMADEGHLIGNHSWSHPDLTQVSNEKLAEELEKVKKKTEEITGVKTMKYLRPPRGIFSERTIDVANKQGYKHVMWSLAYKDWEVNNQKGAQYAYDNIMKQIHPGAILLLHTVSKDNADALESVIKDLKKKGYTFKSLDHISVSGTKKRQ